MCNECDAVWLHPNSVAHGAAIFPNSPDFIVDALGCAAVGPKAGWAELSEIRAVNWDSFIGGEGGE
jgi:hypothetical protein